MLAVRTARSVSRVKRQNNPGCTQGPPVALFWESVAFSPFPFLRHNDTDVPGIYTCAYCSGRKIVMRIN